MGFARTDEQKKRLDSSLNPNLELAAKLRVSNLRLKILQNRYTQKNKGGEKDVKLQWLWGRSSGAADLQFSSEC